MVCMVEDRLRLCERPAHVLAALRMNSVFASPASSRSDFDLCASERLEKVQRRQTRVPRQRRRKRLDPLSAKVTGAATASRTCSMLALSWGVGARSRWPLRQKPIWKKSPDCNKNMADRSYIENKSPGQRLAGFGEFPKEARKRPPKLPGCYNLVFFSRMLLQGAETARDMFPRRGPAGDAGSGPFVGPTGGEAARAGGCALRRPSGPLRREAAVLGVRALREGACWKRAPTISPRSVPRVVGFPAFFAEARLARHLTVAL